MGGLSVLKRAKEDLKIQQPYTSIVDDHVDVREVTEQVRFSAGSCQQILISSFNEKLQKFPFVALQSLDSFVYWRQKEDDF